MRLAVSRPAKPALANNSRADVSTSHTAALMEWAQAEMTADRRSSGAGALQFALLPVGAGELRRLTESSQRAGDEELILLPMGWRDLPRPMQSGDRLFLPGKENDFVGFGDVRIDFSTQEAMRGDSPVTLTSMEFKTLKFFVANPYRVISRDELLNQVWGYDSYPCTRTVDNRILRLRQKLEADAANPKHFLTVYGSGYKFVP